jgi:homocitrate synthase NifV
MHPIPYIIDTTLRDGEQAPGVVFSLEDKIKIAELLEKTNIPEIEIGTPAMGAEEIEGIQCIIKQGFKFKTLSWCRAMKADIDKARIADTNGVHISFPVSDIHLITMGKNKPWVIRMLAETVNYAKNYFEYVTVGAQDASRADIAFLHEFINNAMNVGCSRVRIADTVGILNPFSTYSLFLELKTQFPEMPMEFHGHNDLGMATANTISAFKAGADCASTTVNGLGERAGNAAFEEVVMAWELSLNNSLNINNHVLGELSNTVSIASKTPLPNNKPIVGNKVLMHETGIHTNLILKNRQTYQIINAESIGKNESTFVFGKHSGRNSIKEFYKKKNIFLNESHLILATERIKFISQTLKRDLNETELLRIASEILSKLK